MKLPEPILATAALLTLAAAPAFADTPGDPGRDWRLVRTNIVCPEGQVNAAKMQRGSIVYLIEAGADCSRDDVVEMPAGLHPFELDEVQEAIAAIYGSVGTAPVYRTQRDRIVNVDADENGVFEPGVLLDPNDPNSVSPDHSFTDYDGRPRGDNW